MDAVTADGPEDQVLEGTMAAGSHVDGTWWPHSLNLVVELPGLLAAVRSAGYEVNPVTYHLADWPTGKPHPADTSSEVAWSISTVTTTT